MIKRNTIVLLAVMFIMIGGYILLQKNGWVNFATKKEPTNTPIPLLFDLDTNTIDLIIYDLADLDEVRIQRLEDDKWRINNEGGFITAGVIEQLTSTLNSLKPITILEISPESSATGLDIPTHIISIKLIDGTEHIIKIGDLNPLQTGYYVQIDFEKVVLISKGSIENFLSIIQNAQNPPSPTSTSLIELRDCV